MSVLSELIRERREWPIRRRHTVVRHRHWVVVVETALVAEMLLVALVYQETLTRFFQILLK